MQQLGQGVKIFEGRVLPYSLQLDTHVYNDFRQCITYLLKESLNNPRVRHLSGYGVSQLVEIPRYKLEGRGFDSR